MIGMAIGYKNPLFIVLPILVMGIQAIMVDIMIAIMEEDVGQSMDYQDL